jgi:hypothetical protein
LSSEVEGQGFFEERPSYAKGREEVVEVSRSAEEIMQNNPAFGSNEGQQQQKVDHFAEVQGHAKSAFGALSGILWTGFAATKEAAAAGSEFTSKQIEGTFVQKGYQDYVSPAVNVATPIAGVVFEKTKEGVTFAGNVVVESGKDVYQNGA